MSYNTTYTAAFVQEHSDGQVFTYMLVAASAVFFYDTLLTLAQEVQFIWTTRLRSMTFLYMIARTFTWLYGILSLVYCFLPYLSDSNVLVFNDGLISLEIAIDIATKGILLARVYAIMGTRVRRYLLSSLGTLVLSRLILNMMTLVISKYSQSLLAGHWNKALLCIQSMSSGLTLLVDGAIFGITMYHSWSTVKWMRSRPDMTNGLSLTLLIFQQGVLRFFTIFCLVFMAVMTTDLYSITLGNAMSYVVLSLSVILVLRFFLDLRQQNARLSRRSGTRDLETISTFRAISRGISNSIIEDLGDPQDEALFIGQAMSHHSLTGSDVGQVSHPVPRETAIGPAVFP